MTLDAWIAFIGLGLTVLGAIFCVAVYLIGRIDDVRKASATEDSDLHQRINLINESYLRRDDLDMHLKPLRDIMSEVRADIRAWMGVRHD